MVAKLNNFFEQGGYDSEVPILNTATTTNVPRGKAASLLAGCVRFGVDVDVWRPPTTCIARGVGHGTWFHIHCGSYGII